MISKKQSPKKIAYFSMEFALDDRIPNYAGGLGVLAADILMSAADRKEPMVGVSLIYHKSHYTKKAFDPNKFMERLPKDITLQIEGEEVKIAVYKKEIIGKTGFKVPIYFLNTNIKENDPCCRGLTKHLYPTDWHRRLTQEYILGSAGVKALDIYEPENIRMYHINESHSALLTLELLKKYNYDEDAVRSVCAFSTHTPIAAGHDYFEYEEAYRIMGEFLPLNIKELSLQKKLGLTELAMSLTNRWNSVAKKHKEVCEKMFPGKKFENVTNGIFHPRWIGEPLKKILDKHIPKWDQDPTLLKNVHKIPDEEIIKAKKAQKKELVNWINANPQNFHLENIQKEDLFDTDTLTIGFARRCVPYKRTDLIFNDIERFRKLGHKKIQIIFASHWLRHHSFGLSMKEKLEGLCDDLRGQIKMVVLPDYNLEIAKKMITGCDIWLNNPIPPMEASGTSGMKAALNGCLNISILDGWWIEGADMNPEAGWSFGETSEFLQPLMRDKADAIELYRALHEAIRDYYHHENHWNHRMKEAIALMAYFNTHRVLEEYKKIMWQKG